MATPSKKTKPNLKTVPSTPEVDEEIQETETEEPEADEGLAEIPFRGVTFVVPKNRDDWSTEALAWLAEEKYNLFVKYTLEIARQGQWDTLCTLCPRRRDFADFFVLFGKTIKEECFG